MTPEANLFTSGYQGSEKFDFRIPPMVSREIVVCVGTEVRKIESCKLNGSDSDEIHLIPGKDFVRFGDKASRSQSFAFKDRTGAYVKAILLVSPAGQQFIKSNSGILSDIEQGLVKLKAEEIGVKLATPKDEKKRYIELGVEIGQNRRIDRLTEGNQSVVYELFVEGQRFLLKAPKVILSDDPSLPFNDVSQPYVYEMLQIQGIEADLGSELAKLGFRMPKILFASSQLLCREFEDGTEPDRADFFGKRGMLFDTLISYINRQLQLGNSIWENIMLDLESLYDPCIIRTDNFLKTADGTLVWVDPFFYHPRKKHQ